MTARATAVERMLLDESLDGVMSFLTPVERAAVSELIVADSPRAVLRCVRDNCWLVSDRGRAALKLLDLFMQHLRGHPAAAAVADRSALLELLAEASIRTDRLELPE
nr:hypothetical protein asmbl_30 [uncultured bacterium]